MHCYCFAFPPLNGAKITRKHSMDPEIMVEEGTWPAGGLEELMAIVKNEMDYFCDMHSKLLRTRLPLHQHEYNKLLR